MDTATTGYSGDSSNTLPLQRRWFSPAAAAATVSTVAPGGTMVVNGLVNMSQRQHLYVNLVISGSANPTNNE
jgi:hypothetical protein